MGRISTDIALKTFFDFAINDLRRTPWLLPDIFGCSLETDPLARAEYSKERGNAIQWFSSNKIKTVMHLRKDLAEFPCISIALSQSQEDPSRVTIGDTAFMPIGHAAPDKLTRQPTKIYSEFTPVAYDPVTGEVTMPKNLTTGQLAPGLHMLVEKLTNKAFVVRKVVDRKKFTIMQNCGVDLKDCYIAPVTDVWNTHYGRSYFKESYEIGVHGNSLPMEAIWLSQLVEYVLLRYKAQYLDRRNLKLSTFSASNISRNENYLADDVYSRFFSLQFSTEAYWIESVHPQIAKVRGGILICDGPSSPQELLNEFPSWKMQADAGREAEEDCE